MVCLSCGLSQFIAAETKLASIAKITLAIKSDVLKESSGDVAVGRGLALPAGA
jgi:hypothetical protein